MSVSIPVFCDTQPIASSPNRSIGLVKYTELPGFIVELSVSDAMKIPIAFLPLTWISPSFTKAALPYPKLKYAHPITIDFSPSTYIFPFSLLE